MGRGSGRHILLALRGLACPALLLCSSCTLSAGGGGPERERAPSERPIPDLHPRYAEGPLEGMLLVELPRGSFTMGAPEDEPGRHPTDGPQARVSIGPGIEMMATEVTQAMWRQVTGEDIVDLRDRISPEWPLAGRSALHPVYYVSWRDCVAFAEALSEMDREYVYRLPTEAEWEYACRAGTVTPFYWGADSSGAAIRSCCRYQGSEPPEGPLPVASLKPNPWGLYDMSGNVWELCLDGWVRDLRDIPPDGSAREGADPTLATGRGGCWHSAPEFCRSAYRGWFDRGLRDTGLGFRLVRTRSGRQGRAAPHPGGTPSPARP